MNLITYVRETVSELRLVRWPTRQETTNLTLIVIAISVVTAVYVGGLDFIFTNILKLISK